MFLWIFGIVILLIMCLLDVLLGRWLFRNPPKMNHGIGYRTSRSMRNATMWDAAQRIFGKYYFICGCVLCPISIIGMLLVLGKNEDTVGCAVTILTVGHVVVILAGIIYTELKLKKIEK